MSPKKFFSIGFFILMLFSISLNFFTLALQFLQDPSIITPVSTADYLTCEWNVSSDATSINVSWYNGSTLYKSTIVGPSTTSDVISPYTHKKGENWSCVVNATNGTSFIVKNVSVIIENAYPRNTKLYFTNGTPTPLYVEIVEDTTYNYYVQGFDPDNDPLTYQRLDNDTLTVNLNPSTGDVTITPTASDIGLHNITFISIDSETAVDPYPITITFNVTPYDDPPYFDPALQDQSVLEGECFQYNITAKDEENDTPYNFTISSDLGPRLIIVQLNDTSAQITFNTSQGCRPTYLDRGNHTVYVTVYQQSNSSVNTTSSFNLEVIPVNNPPNISINQTYFSSTQGGELFIKINATDVDNDTITFYTEPLNCTSPISNPWTITTGPTSYGSTGSFAEGYINFTSPNNLTNDHVVCSGEIMIYASDSKQNSSIKINVNISNINDPPSLYNKSNNTVNSHNNIYTYNLTGYENTVFTYQLNYSDPDLLTKFGDTLTFTSNDSNFVPDSNGLINVSINSSLLGNHLVLITVTDSGGLSDNITLNITIYTNEPPYYLHFFPNFTIYEKDTFIFDVNATDTEDCSGNSNCNTIVYSVETTPFLENFSINSSTGLINFTPSQAQIGNYTIKVIASDSVGAKNETNFTLEIVNKNDAPYFLVSSPYTLPGPIVEGHLSIFRIEAFDEDLLLNNSYENLSFAINDSRFNLTKINDTLVELSLLPTSLDVGNHTAELNVTDFYGLNSTLILNYEVLPKSEPPVIEFIKPHCQNNLINNSFLNVSNLSSINLDCVYENTTLVFNHTGYNDELNYSDLNFTWYFDNQTLATYNGLSKVGNYSVQIYFDFFSAGDHELKLVVNDSRLESDTFIWNITVKNKNRDPILINPLPNFTGASEITNTVIYSKYFIGSESEPRFLDPDDDLNSNLKLDGNESNKLVFSKLNECTSNGKTIAEVTIIDADLRIKPIAIGNCTVTFRAQDIEGAFLDSNPVLIVVSEVPPAETAPAPVSSSGGGGSSTRIPVPIPEEIEKPKPIDIIVPEVVTIYTNKTIKIPVELVNNWEGTLNMVRLTAETNVSNMNVTLKFEKNYFQYIPRNSSVKTYLEVSNYRLGENFEIAVKAIVGDPLVEDKALVLINSLEGVSEGEELKTKVTFARDLLGRNPECQELNELIAEAEDKINEEDFDKARELLDAAIEGCRFLISNKEIVSETPKSLESRVRNLVQKHIEYVVLVTALFFLFLITLIIIYFRNKELIEHLENL